MRYCFAGLLVPMAVVYLAGSANGGAALPGDFNESGVYDANDIDMLATEVRQGTNNPTFDLTGMDNKVNAEDRNYLILELIQTKFGDANLDFAVTASGDGAILLSNLGDDQGNKGWADADFDGDQNVTASADGARLLANLPNDGAAVPEPGTLLLVTLAALGPMLWRRWSR